MAKFDEKNEVEIMPDSTERFVMKVDDFKQSCGLWYTLFGKRIIPFLLFIIPFNVLIGRAVMFITRYEPSFQPDGALLNAIWGLALLAFLALLILTPKVATVVEFVLGFAYLAIAFYAHLFKSLLGYFVLITLILFLLVKIVFLVFEIIRMRLSSDDKKNNIERDESGRVIRASNENVVFAEDEEETEAAREHSTPDEDFLFSGTEELAENEENAALVMDDDFCFGSTTEETKNEGAISDSDNDYFFG